MLTPSEWKYIKRLNDGWNNLMDTNWEKRKAAYSDREWVQVEDTDRPSQYQATEPVFEGTMEDYDELEQQAQEDLALRNMGDAKVAPLPLDEIKARMEKYNALVEYPNGKRADANTAEALRRKGIPVPTGVLDYFPLALQEIAKVSKKGNDQHNPGQHLHWNRDLSGDESDALMRHFLERGTVDSDGMLHSAKVAWRALALLEKELERDS